LLRFARNDEIRASLRGGEADEAIQSSGRYNIRVIISVIEAPSVQIRHPEVRAEASLEG
jgi:hypothetical protein